MNKINRVLEKEFLFTLGDMKRLIVSFHSEMSNGLKGEASSLKMIPAYCARPTGEEKGEYIALDLGGTNFRVLALRLKGFGAVTSERVRKYAIDKRHMAGRGKCLFDFIAGSIKDFIETYNLNNKRRHDIGFTFSFPVFQQGIAEGKLVRWTKGFKASGVEGQDVVKLLNKSLAGQGLVNTRVVAITNDTVGTLVSHSYKNTECDMGVILGTGTNACYPEKRANIIKLGTERDARDEMIINIEWGNYDKINQTRYDELLDKGSTNYREQRLEKMVSGMYLGEIARLVLVDMIEKGVLHSVDNRLVDNPYSFHSKYMSVIEGDNTKNLIRVSHVMKDVGIDPAGFSDKRLVKKICRLISERAAKIAASAIIAVVTKMDPALKERHIIAIDGSIFEKYFEFSDRIKKALRHYLKEKSAKIKLALAKDGSGKGACIVAAIAKS